MCLNWHEKRAKINENNKKEGTRTRKKTLGHEGTNARKNYKDTRARKK